VTDAFRGGGYLLAVSAVSVDLEDASVTVRWRPPGVVADRFDHHVLRAFHREGGGRRRALRADRLTIRGLEGAVGTNDPAAGTVPDGGRAVTLRGDRTLEDFYAVFGDELDPVAGATSQPAIGSLV
jgi:hypothetical protein